MLKQEGKSVDGKLSGSESLDLDIYPGPGSLGGSIQSLPPQSPPFILPHGSPNSLDCSWNFYDPEEKLDQQSMEIGIGFYELLMKKIVIDKNQNW